MKKRTWVYCQQPYEYDIECDRCNGASIAWSEFVHMIWCYDCKVDTKGTGGVFDGPIPVGVAKLLGMSFDGIRLSDNKLLNLDELRKMGL